MAASRAVCFSETSGYSILDLLWIFFRPRLGTDPSQVRCRRPGPPLAPTMVARAGALLLLAQAAAAVQVNISSISRTRFPMEGGGPGTVVCTQPALPSPAGAVLGAAISQPGVSLRWPTRGHGFGLAPPVPNGTAGCFTVAPNATDNSGPGLLTLSAPNASTEAAQVTFYESVSVTFGLRPYISETEGSLLLRPAPEVMAAASAAAAGVVHVWLDLPFATPPRTVAWSGAKLKLLTEPEKVLTFDFAGLPATVNADVKITITLPTGANITKWRRLMRAPPLGPKATAAAVQVDHTTKSLLVDGRPYEGVGFYLDGVAHPHYGSAYANLTEYIVKGSAAQLVNHAMIYRLHTFPPEEQLWVLDQAASVGFKVMYEVTSQMDDCGDYKFTNLDPRTNLTTSATCFNDSTAPGLTALRGAIELVKDHPALLGYYICDDCCQSDVGAAYQAQAYNYIKSVDPYHAIIGASDCGDTWVFFDSAATCDTGPNHGGHGGIALPCPPSSADASLAVIGQFENGRILISH